MLHVGIVAVTATSEPHVQTTCPTQHINKQTPQVTTGLTQNLAWDSSTASHAQSTLHYCTVFLIMTDTIQHTVLVGPAARKHF
jgi:hypothetical protein